MVRLGQGMEPEGSPAIVQVVYYLSRAGQLQQPHLIDVTVSPHSNGLYLRDVKERLTAIRGKGVADSYSWSCKRNYKDSYIWQDLTDDDKILPLGDGEFVLKGSGLYAAYRLPGCQIDPERMSLSPKQDPAKLDKKVDTSKKFDFVAVKRSLDLHADGHLPDQNELAAALALSLQIMNNPHGHSRRFSKDKSMDLNQQVMNSLSQAKAGPAEECSLDQYDMSSNETYLSEESSTRKNVRGNSTTGEQTKSTSTSSRTDLNCQPATAKQVERKERKERPVCANNGPKVDVPRGRQEKPEELPSIKTKTKASSGNEPCESAAFMLSPRRIMAVLSTPEKRLGKILHSSSTRSSGLTNSTSMHSAEPLSAMKFSKQTTCLSQLRFCSQLSHQATDSRPDSPVRQNSMEVLVQSSAMPQSPTVHGHGGQYWARWKAGRKVRSSEAKVGTDEPSTPTQADTPLPEDRTTSIRRVLKTSFEFDRPANVSSSGPGTPSLHTRTSSSTESSNPPSQLQSRKLIKPSSSGTFISSADTPHCLNVSSTVISNAEVITPIAVKEVITEHLPIQQSASDSGQNFSCGALRSSNGKDESTRMHSMADSGPDFSIDTASLPRVSISDSISAVRAPVHVRTTRSESPESPLNPNPPCSPVRANSPAGPRSPGRTLSSPASFSRRTEDGRARARGLVKEVASKDSRFMKDLTKELERSKISSCSMRSIASSTRVPGINKNSTTSIGGKSISSTFNRSPPRISSMLWEDPPHAPKQSSSMVDRDDRPLTAGRSIIDWEKTLQESASVSLPPPDFGQILQECG